MKSGFLILNNICHVQNFALNILSNVKPSDAISIDDILTSANLRVEFRDRKNIFVKDPGKLCSFHGKLAFAANVKYREGNIDLTWGGQDGSLTMRMNYEIVNAVDQAYSCDQFFTEIQEIIQKHRALDESDDEERILHHFLIPHISGVLHDLYQLEHPVDASYELIGKHVKIHGIPETSLLEYGLNQQRDEESKISIPVLMSGHEVEMHWNRDTDEWNLADNIVNDIPRNGKLQIGYKRDPINDGNKNHDHNKLRLMLTCLNDLKTRIGSPGHEILRGLFKDRESIDRPAMIDTMVTQNIGKISVKLGCKQAYDAFDDGQKRCIEEIYNKKVISVNGEGGSGKTEVGAFAAAVAAILGYKTLITTETNPAIDNFLQRMDEKFRPILGVQKRLNIVRLRSRKQIAPTLNSGGPGQNELEFEIKRLQKDINDHFSTTLENAPDFQLKRQFYDIFSKSDVLERFIVLTYDIILATYGIICERKFFLDPTHLFDLNIVDASSSVNFSAFSLGARNSRRWIFLNDKQQIAPLTVGDFLLKQPLRFPEKEELSNAAKYDPKDAELRKTRVIWDSKRYKESAAAILGHLDQVSSHFLKNQYRIHPDLYNKICKVFERTPVPRKKSPIKYLDLTSVSPLLSSGQRLIYQNLDVEEITTQMGKNVAILIDDIQLKAKEIRKPITIGIACTDVASLRKMVRIYQDKKGNVGLSRSGSWNFYQGENEHVRVTFCSIKSHQEREYDVFVLGIIKNTSPDFDRRVYTALTRASSYALVFGPRFKKIYSPPRNKQDQNKMILERLEEM